MMKKNTVGIIQMVVCATLWSMGGILIKLIGAGPFMIAGIRSFFAALCMAVSKGIGSMFSFSKVSVEKSRLFII